MGSWREGRASVAEGALARAFQLGLRYSSAWNLGQAVKGRR
jgi:hypothetical protein